MNDDFKLPLDQLPSIDRLDVLNVPEETGRLSHREIEITDCDGTHLVAKMAAGLWTAEEVTIAYLKRATIGQQLVLSSDVISISCFTDRLNS